MTEQGCTRIHGPGVCTVRHLGQAIVIGAVAENLRREVRDAETAQRFYNAVARFRTEALLAAVQDDLDLDLGDRRVWSPRGGTR